MNAKFYGKGRPIGKEDLDELTGDFDVRSLLHTFPLIGSVD